MTFRLALDVSTYLLLLAGFTAVAAAGGLEPVSILLFLLALVISWWRRPLPISNLQQFLAVLGFLVIYGLDLTGGGDLVGATIRLLLLLACFKLLTLGSGRDYLLVYLISFALLLIASVFTLSIVYLVALIVYLFLSVLTLILFESSRGYAKLPAARFSVRGYLATAFGITGLTLLLAVPIFLAVPRLTIGFLEGQKRPLTGFSDTVELGDLGPLLRSSEIVMRVTVDTPHEQLSPELKWRGIALDLYDGRRWRSRRARGEPLPADRQGSYRVRSRSPGPLLLGQEIIVEPLSQVVFGAPDVVQVTLRGQPNTLWRDPAGNLRLQWDQDQPLNYFVYSEILPRQERFARIEAGTIPNRIRAIYLQLPEIETGVRELAERVSVGARSDLERALLLENFLRSDFEYTLSNPSGSAEDPLTDFLLVSRAGHCEYFATAQAVMLRLLGIPARVVNGFRAGSFHPWAGHFTVRQSDAHSWVEAYFPGAGWIEFDPTPLDRIRQAVGVAGLIAQAMDTLDLFWNEVITFNRDKQAGFFTSMARRVEDQWSVVTSGEFWTVRAARLRAWTVETIRSHPELLAVPLVLWVLIWAVIRYRHRLLLLYKRASRAQPATLAPAYYRALLMVLGRRGLAPHRGETPGEFARRCREALHSEIPVRMTRLYYACRWGGCELDEREMAEMAADLKRLEAL